MLLYDPMVIIVPPNKLAPDGMVGISELVDKHYGSSKKVVVTGLSSLIALFRRNAVW